MTDIVLAPRLEDPDSDTEPIVSLGWAYRVRVARTRTDGQWVIPEWPYGGGWRSFTGSSVTLKLDPLDAIPYELELRGPVDPATRKIPLYHEFRFVKTATSSGAMWETLDQASDAGGSPVLPSADQARLTAVEAALANVSGGATSLSALTGVSADGKTLIETGSTFADMRADLGAAQDSAVVHLAGTETITGTKTINTASVGTLTVTTAANVPTASPGDNDTSAASTAFVTAAIAALGTVIAVPAVTGVTLRLTFQTTDVNATRPTVPSGVSIAWEVPGDTAPTNIRWDLGDVWTSVYS